MEPIGKMKKIPFELIQCTSDYVDNLEAIAEGALYFVLDTKQILLGKNSQLISMGKGSGIHFAEKTIDGFNVSKEISFEPSDFEDPTVIPQIDDLIFNKKDSSFYRVIGIKEEKYVTNRLTISGGGGGGYSGGYGGTSGGSSAEVDFGFSYIKEEGVDNSLPSLVVAGTEDVYQIKVRLDATVNGGVKINEIKQTIIINNSKRYTSWVKTWMPINIEIANSRLVGGTNNIQVQYSYGDYYDNPIFLGSIEVLDLSIRDTDKKDFQTAIAKPTSTGSFNFSGEISYLSTAQHRIYFSLVNEDEKECVQCYPYGYLTDNGKAYLVQNSGHIQSVTFSKLQYGKYVFKVRQEITYDEKVYIGPEYSYNIISVYNGTVDDEPLMFCDFSSFSNQEIGSNVKIKVPVILYDPRLKDEQFAKIEIGYIDADGEDHVLGTPNVTLNANTQVSFPSLIAGEYSIYIKYSYEMEDEWSIPQTMELKETCLIKVVASGIINATPVMHLSAEGRTNLEDDNAREVWTSGDAKTIFENFTWEDGSNYINGTGWCLDSRQETVLRVGGNAKAIIDYNPFTDSIAQSGFAMTFDFVVKNFSKRNDIDNPIINCYDKNKKFGIKVYGDSIQFLCNDPIKLSFLEGERMHVAFLISPVYPDYGKGLIEVYLNGILTQVKVYQPSDIPTEFNDVEFFIGSENAIIDMYSIKHFTSFLNSSAILENFIADMKTYADGEKISKENDIYLNGKINIDKVRENTDLPVMILKGELPTRKIDKTKKVDIEFKHPEASKSFIEHNIPIEVQGTSSQYYPVLNYKIKKIKGPEGKGYQLDETQIPTSTFCLKADYAESTGTHNTQNANFVETFYSAVGAAKNPAQVMNSKCRTTIWGYPILVFHEHSDGDGLDTQIDFLGKYNFNFDKGSKEVFGFDGTFKAECWEFKDNDPIAGFQKNGFNMVNPKFTWDKWKVIYRSEVDTSQTVTKYFPEDNDPDPNRGWVEDIHNNYDYVKEKALEFLESQRGESAWWSKAVIDYEKIIPLWMTYFEPRYCDDSKILKDIAGNPIKYKTDDTVIKSIDPETGEEIFEDEWENIYDISNFANLYNWVMSTADNPEEFKENVSTYFDTTYLNVYYVYTMFAMMVDQRAKNMFFTYWEPVEIGGVTYGGKWCPWFYDNDTCFGIDNAGMERFDYDSEDDNTDQLQIFQGENSVLWLNLKSQFFSTLKTTYNTLRETQLKEENFRKYFIDNSANKWPASVYNEDQEVKYIKYAYTPMDVGGEKEEVIKKLRGCGKEHLLRFIKDRLFYCDGRWGRIDTEQAITVRPTVEDTDLTLRFKPFTTGYYSYLYGADTTDAKTDLFVKEGEMSGKMQAGQTYPKTFDMHYSSANVTYFTGGEHISDFGDISILKPREITASNGKKLEVLTLGGDNAIPNNELNALAITSPSLKTINMTNVLYSGKSLDLMNCPNVRNIYAKKSEIVEVTLPIGGYVETMELSDTIQTFKIQKQLNLKENKVTFTNNNDSNTKSAYRNLNQIIIEDCPNFDSKTFIRKCLQAGNFDDEKLTKKTIRITGIDYIKDKDSKPILQDKDGNLINNYWVFENADEFKDFVNLFVPDENSKISLDGKNNNGLTENKPYLEGCCFVKGQLLGEDIKKLYDNISGNFIVESDFLSSKVSFYVYNEQTKESIPIKMENGENYIQTVSKGDKIAVPKYDKNITVPILDYLKEDPEFSYSHNATSWTSLWNPSQGGTPQKTEVQLFSKPVYQDLEVYAIYTKSYKYYKISLYNGNEHLEDITNIQYGRGKTDEELLQKYPKDSLTLEGQTLTWQDYSFSGKWIPSPNVIKCDTVCNAVYDYTAYQSFKLLDKNIEVFEIQNLDYIEEYAFYGCDQLKKIILDVDKVIPLRSVNAFTGSSVLTNTDPNEKGLKKCLIYVPANRLEQYMSTDHWKEFSESFIGYDPGEEVNL